MSRLSDLFSSVFSLGETSKIIIQNNAFPSETNLWIRSGNWYVCMWWAMLIGFYYIYWEMFRLGVVFQFDGSQCHWLFSF